MLLKEKIFYYYYYSEKVKCQISAFKLSVFRTVYTTELRAKGFLECQETEVLYFIQYIHTAAPGYEAS